MHQDERTVQSDTRMTLPRALGLGCAVAFIVLVVTALVSFLARWTVEIPGVLSVHSGPSTGLSTDLTLNPLVLVAIAATVAVALWLPGRRRREGR